MFNRLLGENYWEEFDHLLNQWKEHGIQQSIDKECRDFSHQIPYESFDNILRSNCSSFVYDFIFFYEFNRHNHIPQVKNQFYLKHFEDFKAFLVKENYEVIKYALIQKICEGSCRESEEKLELEKNYIGETNLQRLWKILFPDDPPLSQKETK